MLLAHYTATAVTLVHNVATRRQHDATLPSGFCSPPLLHRLASPWLGVGKLLPEQILHKQQLDCRRTVVQVTVMAVGGVKTLLVCLPNHYRAISQKRWHVALMSWVCTWFSFIGLILIEIKSINLIKIFFFINKVKLNKMIVKRSHSRKMLILAWNLKVRDCLEFHSNFRFSVKINT